MLADKWKNTYIMVKTNPVLPGNFVVAQAALGALFLFMDIIQFMTAVTGGVNLPGFGIFEVTSLALQFLMLAPQGEIGFGVMIKRGEFPFAGIVTILALLAVLPFVGVISTMTAITISGRLALFGHLVVGCMTVVAGCFEMFAV